MLDAESSSRYYRYTMVPEEQAEDPQRPEARAQVERRIQRYASRGPYRLNPDSATVEHVLVGLTRNMLRYGRAYCPCREVTGEPERDRPNICPCPQHPADIARDGVCECGLFVSAAYVAAPSGAPKSISEEEA